MWGQEFSFQVGSQPWFQICMYIHTSRKLAVASWSLSCFSKEGGSPGLECFHLIYQDYNPPPRGVQLHPSPPRYLLLLLGRCCCCCCWHLIFAWLLAACWLLLLAACMLGAAGCSWLLAGCCCLLLLAACMAACCLLSAPFCCCCCGLLAAVGAEESLFVKIESSCIPSES